MRSLLFVADMNHGVDFLHFEFFHPLEECQRLDVVAIIPRMESRILFKQKLSYQTPVSPTIILGIFVDDVF